MDEFESRDKGNLAETGTEQDTGPAGAEKINGPRTVKTARPPVKEEVNVVPYDPQWPVLFEEEKEHLLSCLPKHLIGRIEHFGSTAVPDLPAKPIVDMLVEVTDLDETRRLIAPSLEAQGYEYFWRPTRGDDVPPFYAWFIKRDKNGKRTHHIHMVEDHFEHWERLLFRDYLVEHPNAAKEYGALKLKFSQIHRNDRIAYTEAKTDFIVRVTGTAKEYYGRARPDGDAAFYRAAGPSGAVTYVPLLEVSEEEELAVVQSVLAHTGIPCIVRGPGMLPARQHSGGQAGKGPFRIDVPGDDLWKARDILLANVYRPVSELRVKAMEMKLLSGIIWGAVWSALGFVLACVFVPEDWDQISRLSVYILAGFTALVLGNAIQRSRQKSRGQENNPWLK